MLDNVAQLIEDLARDAARPHPFFHPFILVEGKQNLFTNAPGEFFNAVEIIIEVVVGIQTIISGLSSRIDRIVPVSTHCMWLHKQTRHFILGHPLSPVIAPFL